MTIRPRRSALYMPATNARAIDKARGLACDAVILDLEDAVAPDDKPAARTAAVAAVTAGGFGARELVVRINALDTPWGGDDLAVIAAARPDAILLPKPDDDRAVADCVARAGGVAVWAMVETPRAVLAIDRLAATPGLAALVLGTNDLAKDLRAMPGPDRVPLHPWMAATVAAARAHGLAVLDGVFNAIDDDAGLAAECAQGRAFGFDGKTLIHPRQIAAANAAFGPDAAAVAWAERVVAAWSADPQAGVIRVDGRMVERLHLAQAQETLAIATVIATR